MGVGGWRLQIRFLCREKIPWSLKQLTEKGFISVYSSEGIEFTMAEKTWLLMAGTRNCVIALHLYSGRRGREGGREGGDGKWRQNVTSQSLTPVPLEGSITSLDSTTIWRPRVQTHDLWGSIHTQAATALERQLIGGVGKKGPPLEPALRAFAFEWQEGNDRDPRQAEKQTESQAISGLKEIRLWSQYVTAVLVLNWCRLSN